MIKLSIKNQEKSEVEKEFEGILSLCQEEDGSVTLTVEDEEFPNAPWNILSIKSNGTVYRSLALPDNIGLQVDSDGRIIESEE